MHINVSKKTECVCCAHESVQRYECACCAHEGVQWSECVYIHVLLMKLCNDRGVHIVHMNLMKMCNDLSVFIVHIKVSNDLSYLLCTWKCAMI